MSENVKENEVVEKKIERSNVDDVLLGVSKPVPVEKEDTEELPLAAEYEEGEPETENTEEKVIEGKDEYGNEVEKEKQKVYTEEEVNRMMRDRFNREQSKKQDEQKTIQKHPEESDDGWETQLKSFVKETLNESVQEQKRNSEMAREKQLQTEFEERFANGIKQYKDFETVVRGKPIDDVMMMATRSMKNPASFLYAASKSWPKELERISQLNDPYAKVAEIGRLEERMRKVRSGTSSPRVIAKVSGDVENRQNHRQSVDELIAKDMQKKFSTRRY